MSELHLSPLNTVFFHPAKPYKGRVEKAKVQRATGEFLLEVTGLLSFSLIL